MYNPRISKFAPVGPVKRNKIGLGVMSPLYSVFAFNKNENLDFFELYFFATNWYHYMNRVANFGARFDRMNITTEDFYKMPIVTPQKDEQHKIVSFLTNVDEKIEELKNKKLSLEKYKKGVMRKIFSQEIRFKNEDGKDFEEWEEKRLKDFDGLITGDGDWILSEDISLGGKYKIIQLGNIGFGKYVEKKLKTISNKKFIEIKGTLIEKGDLLINRMVDNNFYCCIMEKTGDYITSVDVCWIRENSYFNNYFLMALISSEKNQKRLLSLSSGSGRVRISRKNLFNEFKFKLPSLLEQQKIAEFLLNLDGKIECISNELKKAQKFKKGLLQGLFV